VPTLKKQLATLQQISLDEKDVRVVKAALDFVFYVMKLLVSVKVDGDGGTYGALDISLVNKFITQVTENVKSAQTFSHFWSGLCKCNATLLLEGGLFESILTTSPHQARAVFDQISTSQYPLRELCGRVAVHFEQAQRHKLVSIVFLRSCFDKLRARIGLSEAQKVFKASTIAPILATYTAGKFPPKLQKSAQQMHSLLVQSQDGKAKKVKSSKRSFTETGDGKTLPHQKQKKQKNSGEFAQNQRKDGEGSFYKVETTKKTKENGKDEEVGVIEEIISPNFKLQQRMLLKQKRQKKLDKEKRKKPSQ